jgi:hypothetical protein
MTDPVVPPDERERTRDTERRGRSRLRAILDIERRITSDATLADRGAPADVDALERIAAERRYVPVVSEAQREREAGPQRGIAIARHAVNVIFVVAYALLALRLLLGALRANPEAPFVQWVLNTSEPLHAPFLGLFPNVVIEDGFTFALSVAFAILVYAMFHALIHALLRLPVISRRSF